MTSIATTNMRRLVILWMFCFISIYALQAQKMEPTYESISDSLGDLYLNKALMVYAKSYDSTFIYVQESLRHYQTGKNWEGTINCYSALSTLYNYKGDYLKYDSLVNIAFDIASTKLDKKSKAYGSVLNNYAFKLVGMGNDNRAIRYYKETLTIDHYDGNKLNIATSLTNLGTTYLGKGDFEEGLIYLKEAYQYYLDTLGESWRSATTAIKIAKGFRSSYQFQEAENWYTHAEKILLQERKILGDAEVVLKPLTYALFNLGELALEKKDWKEARRKSLQAKKLSEKVYVVNKGWADDILSEINRQQENYMQALIHLRESKRLVVEECRAFKKHPLIAEKDLKIALVYREMGNWELAIKHYHLALENVTYGSSADDLNFNPPLDSIYGKIIGLEALQGKAASCFQLFQKDKNEEALQSAYQIYQLALQLIPTIRQDFLHGKSKELLSSRVLSLYEGAIEVAILYYKRTGEARYLEEAFNYAESNKAILLLESINEMEAKNFGGIPDSLMEKENQLNLEIKYYERLANEEKRKSTQNNPKAIVQLQRKLFELNEQYQTLVASFEKNYPQYYQLKYKTILTTIPDIQKKLEANAALLEYFVGQEHIYIFTITKNDIQVHQFLNEKDFAQKVETIRQLISQPPAQQNLKSGFQQYTSSAFYLFQKLIEPVITEDIKSLIIVPDDILGLLPFETLLTTKPQNDLPNYSLSNLNYLIEDFDISYTYSSTLLLNSSKEKKPAGKNIFVGFAPSFTEPELLR